MRTFIATLSLITILLIAGCNHGGGAVVGKWQGTAVPEKGHENDPSNAMAKSLAGAISFELKADKTFSGNMIFPVEGTYTVTGNTVTLTMTKMMGIDSKASSDNKPLVFQLSSDGKTMTAQDAGSGKDQTHGSLVLTKQS